MNILFVCTGNTCRSSMAEGIFKKMLQNLKEDINVSSAGINVFEGEWANEKAINVLKKKGIDISSHRAKQITNKIIESSDLILTMTVNHKYEVKKISPKSINKVYTLKEYSRLINCEEIDENNLDIADPYGMDYNMYDKCMMEIEAELKKIIKNINKITI